MKTKLKVWVPLATLALISFACSQKSLEQLDAVLTPDGDSQTADSVDADENNLNEAPAVTFTYITAPQASISFGNDNKDFVPSVPVGNTSTKFVVLAKDPDGDPIGKEVRIINTEPALETDLLRFSAIDGLCKEDHCNFSISPADVIPPGRYKITLGISDAPTAEILAADYAAKESQAILNIDFVAEMNNLAPVLEVYDRSGNRIDGNTPIVVRVGQKAEVMIQAKDSDNDPIDNQLNFTPAQGCLIRQIPSVNNCSSVSECKFLFTIDCGSRAGTYQNTFTIYDKPERDIEYQKSMATVIVNVR